MAGAPRRRNFCTSMEVAVLPLPPGPMIGGEWKGEKPCRGLQEESWRRVKLG